MRIRERWTSFSVGGKRLDSLGLTALIATVNIGTAPCDAPEPFLVMRELADD